MQNGKIKVLDKVIVVEVNCETNKAETLYVGEVTTLINKTTNNTTKDSIFLNCVYNKDNVKLYFADVLSDNSEYGLTTNCKAINTANGIQLIKEPLICRYILPINFDFANSDLFKNFIFDKTRANDLIETFLHCVDNKGIKPKQQQQIQSETLITTRTKNSLGYRLKNKVVSLLS